MKKRTVLAIILVITLFAVGSAVKDQLDNKDNREIEQVITEATALTHGQLMVPPKVTYIDAQAKINPEDKKMMFDKIDSTMPDYYTGSLLQDRIGCMKGAIEANEMDGIAFADGCGCDVYNLTIEKYGDTAVAEADITLWMNMTDAKGSQINPGNGVHEIFTLVREDGKWKISKDEFTFLPGQGP